MKILFLHGLESKPGGTKAKVLAEAGHEIFNPALPKDSFEESMEITCMLLLASELEFDISTFLPISSLSRSSNSAIFSD